jgi:predicted AlkP superfamily pyrophosphatase or phosphodiesterase
MQRLFAATVATLAPLLLAVAPPEPGRAKRARATDLRTDFLERFARSYFPGRSGQIAVVPREGHIMTKRDPSTRFMHGSPWPYDSRIPFLIWGPAFVRHGTFRHPVVLQDMAPTLAELIGVPMPSTCTGRSQSAVLAARTAPPRVVLMAVLDGMRIDYFDRLADTLPNLGRLRREGAWFVDARLNYLPTITSLAHATVATGADPRVHGIVANASYDWVGGRPVDAYPGLAPVQLMALTLADVWSIRTRGRAVVIGQGSAPRAAIPLAGHGSCLLNGRKVLAASYSAERGKWETNDGCFRLPDYLKALDARRLLDGTDGTWMGHPIATLDEIRRSGLFSKLETEALRLAIERERVGTDEVTDLVLVNLKTPDYVGHVYGPDSPELAATLASLDRDIGEVLATIEAAAGRDSYVVAFTADHGMPSEPDAAKGQVRAYTDDIVKLVHSTLDPEKGALVKHYEPENMQMAIDTDRLRELGLDLGSVSRLLEAQPYVFAAFTEDDLARASVGLAR